MSLSPQSASTPSAQLDVQRPPSAARLRVVRALWVSLGAVLAVLPLVILRMVAAPAVTLAVDGGGLWLYLPCEFLIAMAVALFLLRKKPAEKSLPLVLWSTGLTVVLTPLALAMLGAVSYLGISDQVPSIHEALAMVLAVAPSLGALGLVGFLFTFFPMVLIGLTFALVADGLYCRAHRPTLAELERRAARAQREPELQERLSALACEEVAAMTRERQQIVARLVRTRQSVPQLHRLRGMLHDQAEAAEERFARFAHVLGMKLSPQEVTFHRYLASARQVYRRLLSQLGEAAALIDAVAPDGGLGLEERGELERIIEANERAILALDEAAQALARIRTQAGASLEELAVAVCDLEDMARRARDYSV